MCSMAYIQSGCVECSAVVRPKRTNPSENINRNIKCGERIQNNSFSQGRCTSMASERKNSARAGYNVTLTLISARSNINMSRKTTARRNHRYGSLLKFKCGLNLNETMIPNSAARNPSIKYPSG